MPLYEYLCGACGHRFERIQKFSDPLVTECPTCGARQVEKLVSSPAIQFKGSGWYITDYAKSGAKPASDSSPDSKKPAVADGGSSSSSDSTTPPSSSDSSAGTKPAAKPEAK